MIDRADASTRVRSGRGALQTIDNTLAFLRQHPPYDELDEALLRDVLQHAELAYYAQNRAIIGPEAGLPRFFCVVQQGLVRGTRRDAGRDAPALFEAGPGETFLAAALFQQRATRTVHLAAEDSFVVQIPRDQFQLLLNQSERFRGFCERRASVLVERARDQMRAQVTAEMHRAATLDTRLDALTLRSPVTCDEQTSVQTAVRRMHEAEVGSIVVLGADARPSGIFTLRDLRTLVAGGNATLDGPITSAMTQAPKGLTGTASLFDAASLMLEHRIAHLLVVDGPRLVGVVSERDLFTHQHVDMVSLARTLSACGSVSAIAEVRQQIQRVVSAMLAQGASGRQLTRLITQLNDVAVRRVLDLARQTEPQTLPAITWLAFGSEARAEQTLHTDQDNALLFDVAPGDTAAAQRDRLLPFAQRVNRMLAEIGFPLCPGNVMAGNPELCLSREEWSNKYSELIESQSPQALLKGSIYLDARATAGETDAFDQVLASAVAAAQRNTQFLHALAQVALGFRPALGLIRSFATRRAEQGRLLDLKKNGLQSFVAATRTLALANGLTLPNTEERLDALAAMGVLDPRDSSAWTEAFSFLQVLRMRAHQQQSEQGLALSNEIDPDSLNPLDRRILKEALRQAQRLHDRLKLDYS